MVVMAGHPVRGGGPPEKPSSRGPSSGFVSGTSGGYAFRPPLEGEGDDEAEGGREDVDEDGGGAGGGREDAAVVVAAAARTVLWLGGFGFAQPALQLELCQ